MLQPCSPNGIYTRHDYDAAGRLTRMRNWKSGTMLGDLVYAYDAAGRRTSVSGSLAQDELPQAVSSATYDAANRLTSWGRTTVSHNANTKSGGQILPFATQPDESSS